MDSLFLVNLTAPPLLFFFLGISAVLVRSDLEIPTQVAKFLSIYLLFAIGFKGGVALAESDLDKTALFTLAAALILSAIVPVYVFFVLRRRLAVADAAAVAATYGSISAVTFVTCTSYLDAQGISWSGYLVAAMALMESPAIIIGILLYRMYSKGDDNKEAVNWRELLHESCLNGSVFLIFGSLVIGAISGAKGMAQVSVFVEEIFIGFLCLFLLDMGLVAARRLMDLRSSVTKSVSSPPGTLVAIAIVLPLVNAVLAGGFAWMLNLPEGDAVLLIVLGASASYIAVPAAMRLALPEASPSIYLPMSLAVTFPLNLLVGIPLYHAAVRLLLPT